MKNWRLLIFDMDDTLYPEQDYVLSGFQAVAKWAEHHLGIAADMGYEHLQGLYQSGVRGDTFNQWLAHFNSTDNTITDDPSEILKQLIQTYRDHTPELYPFPHVRQSLMDFKKKYQIGLISDGYLEVQKRKFSALKIAEYFDAVVFSDQFGRQAWKPSHKPYLEVLRQIKEAPQNSVYIGDNPLKDFAGPRSLGMASIWLRWNDGEYVSHEPPCEKFAPDIVMNSWIELNEYLLN